VATRQIRSIGTKQIDDDISAVQTDSIVEEDLDITESVDSLRARGRSSRAKLASTVAVYDRTFRRRGIIVVTGKWKEA